jgi:hypothetical protein
MREEWSFIDFSIFLGIGASRERRRSPSENIADEAADTSRLAGASGKLDWAPDV